MGKLFNIIVAFTQNTRAIGYQNGLPWPMIKEDMDHFREITTVTKDKEKQNAVIMGKNTWLSIPQKYRPLKNRFNIVLTSTLKLDIPTATSLNQALELCDSTKIEKIFIIGGERLYNEAIKDYRCDKIYTTEILGDYEYDTVFPKLPKWFALDSSEQVNEKIVFKNYRNIADPNSEENQYLECLRRILNTGEKAIDRTKVGTLSLFDENMNFTIETINPEDDPIKHQYRIPALTTKRIFFRGVIWELIWFLNGITNAKWLQDRGVHIWDGNSTKEYLRSINLNYEDGELGPVYGHQWVKWGATETTPGINQIKNIINLLRKSPTSRRAVLSAWNVGDLSKMALPPCHLMYMFKVTNHHKKRKTLNCKVIIRSNDMGLGSPFNIMSTSILLILMSRALNMLPGKIAISINDAHIYLNHIKKLKIQIGRVPLEKPLLTINQNINDYEDMIKLEYKDFKISDYHYWPGLKMPMAV